MALIKQLKDLEFTKGLETYSEAKRAPQVNLLDLENAVFAGGVPTIRDGGEALPDDTSTPESPLSTAVALETASGEMLRWTQADSNYSAGVWTKTQQADTWTQRAGTDVGLPLVATFENVVNGAASAEAHDCLSLGGLDVVVWTESADQGQARALRSSVRERATQRVLQLNTVLSVDGSGPGDEVWRLQPRLAQVDSGSLAVFYVVDGELICRVLQVASPSAWGAEVTLASDVANRVGPRYPFEIDAVGSSTGAVVVWTGSTQNSAELTASANTGGNPAPALLIDPSSIYVGDIVLVVTQATTLAVTQESVWDATVAMPTAARASFGITGYVLAQVTALPSVSVARDVISSGTSVAPTVAYQTAYPSGTLGISLYRNPYVRNATNRAWADMRLDTAGNINSYGAGGGVVRATVTARFEGNFEDNVPRRATVHVTGPSGFSQTLTMFEPELPNGGSEQDWHALTGLGYSFALPDLDASLSVKGQYWEWVLYPTIATFSVNGAASTHLRPDSSPYYTHSTGGVPIALDAYSGASLHGTRTTFSGTSTGLYTSSDSWTATLSPATAKYSVNGGSYGSDVNLYAATGAAYAYSPATGLTFTWPAEFPTKLSVQRAATGTVTLGGGAGNVTVVLNGTSVGPVAFNASDTQTAADVAAALNANGTLGPLMTATSAGPVITITWDTVGPGGNVALSASRTAGSISTSGANLAGGRNNDVFRLTAPTGQFTYQLGSDPASSPLDIYNASGAVIVRSLSDGGPIGIDVRWPANTPHLVGESWTYTIDSSGRVVRAAVGQTSGVPSIIAGPYDLNVEPLDGLTLDKHGDENLDTTLIFRDRTESEVHAWVFTSALTATSGPLVLAGSGDSNAADGLLHVATYLEDTGTVVAILEPTGQHPLEVVFFTQAGVEGSVITFARQLRLLSRPFLVGQRWCLATLWMADYGGVSGTTVGLQPTAFILDIDSRNNGNGGLVGRLLAGNAAPLLSSGLPKTLATDEGTARFLVPRRSRLQLQRDGASLVDVSVTGLTAITLADANPAAVSCVEDEGGLHLGGTFPRYYDGAHFVEDGFCVYPEGVTVAFSSGGDLSAGQYSWQLVYEWTDSRGRRHTSAPSVPVLGTATSGQKATLTVPLLHLTEKQEVRIAVYRTEHDGTTHYRTTLLSYVQPDALEQDEDTVDLVDDVADEAITTNEILYTDGGELDHFPPPPYTLASKHLEYFFTNDMEDTSGFSWSLPARRSEGTAWSDAFNSRVNGVVSGFATLDEKLIIFTDTVEYVVLGRGPDITGANSSFSDFPQLVTGSVGCSNPQSIVSTPLGVFHFSAAGLYLLTRTLEDTPAGDSVSRYADLTISKALLLDTMRQVRFYTEEGTTLVLDYTPQVLQWSVFTGQQALDAVIFGGAVHYCTGSKVVRESEDATTEDGEVFSVKVGSAWLKFSSFQGAQRIWHCMLLGTLGTSMEISASTYYNYKEVAHDTKVKLVLGPEAGGEELLQLRHALSKQVCEAFRFVWVFTPTPQSPSDTGKLVLNGMTLEVGVKPGRAKLNNDRNF